MAKAFTVNLTGGNNPPFALKAKCNMDIVDSDYATEYASVLIDINDIRDFVAAKYPEVLSMTMAAGYDETIDRVYIAWSVSK